MPLSRSWARLPPCVVYQSRSIALPLQAAWPCTTLGPRRTCCAAAEWQKKKEDPGLELGMKSSSRDEPQTVFTRAVGPTKSVWWTCSFPFPRLRTASTSPHNHPPATGWSRTGRPTSRGQLTNPAEVTWPPPLPQNPLGLRRKDRMGPSTFAGVPQSLGSVLAAPNLEQSPKLRLSRPSGPTDNPAFVGPRAPSRNVGRGPGPQLHRPRPVKSKGQLLPHFADFL